MGSHQWIMIMGRCDTNYGNTDYGRESADRTKLELAKTKITVPIPSDGDSTDQNEDDDLYDDKLLPQEKLRLKGLETDKRNKQQNYTPKYLKDKEKAISKAEKDRLCGMLGPDY